MWRTFSLKKNILKISFPAAPLKDKLSFPVLRVIKSERTCVSKWLSLFAMNGFRVFKDMRKSRISRESTDFHRNGQQLAIKDKQIGEGEVYSYATEFLLSLGLTENCKLKLRIMKTIFVYLVIKAVERLSTRNRKKTRRRMLTARKSSCNRQSCKAVTQLMQANELTISRRHWISSTERNSFRKP